VTIYTIRRRFLVNAVREARQTGAAVQQLRMELAALRSCRALVA